MVAIAYTNSHCCEIVSTAICRDHTETLPSQMVERSSKIVIGVLSGHEGAQSGEGKRDLLI